MGEYFQPGREALPQTQESPWTGSNYFRDIMSGQNAPNQVQFPGAPATQQGIESLQQFGQQQAPELSRFYSEMMQGGGMPQMNQAMDAQAQLYQNMVDQITAQAGTMPLGSARDRYFGQALGQATSAHNLQNQQMLLDQINQANQNRFAGAQGLQSVPGLMAAPSQLEMQLLGARSPYDLANQQAAANMYNTQAAMLQPLLQPQGIDYLQTPSLFEQQFGWLGPIMSAGMQGYGSGLGTAIGE